LTSEPERNGLPLLNYTDTSHFPDMIGSFDKLTLWLFCCWPWHYHCNYLDNFLL